MAFTCSIRFSSFVWDISLYPEGKKLGIACMHHPLVSLL
ncbi:hypothetical protein QY97_03241 [Bacillus thermotolerans]|uniref:Uncharacterized protein n=1 Tax=Bacillus thermotolerans TaxID=1221996 RepID=A0A0F5HJH3_BACTR|nr:hypothetical protein QY97_03241 [Bacillus thermotolerans]KKB36277.1 hypothetical protein QY95_03141 [Bacillus thermotolerans]